jgi:hypothetical protein
MKGFQHAMNREVQGAKSIELNGPMISSSGKKSVAVLLAATNKLVLEKIEQMTEAARKKGMAPVSVVRKTLIINSNY